MKLLEESIQVNINKKCKVLLQLSVNKIKYSSAVSINGTLLVQPEKRNLLI